MFQVRDPAGVRSVVGEVPAMTAAGLPDGVVQVITGLRFYTRIKTTAVRYQW